SAYLGATSAVLTILILVFSEIIPKSLGAAYWHRLAVPIGVMIEWMTRALAPLVWLSQKMTGLLAPDHAKPSTFSRAEMEAMAAAGVEEGHIDQAEMTIVSNLMRLSELSVRDVMSPRPVLFTCPGDMTVREFFVENVDEPFSRIPIYAGDPDEVTGYVHQIDLLRAQAEGETQKPLSHYRRDFTAIPDFVTLLEAFNTLLHLQAHAALVVDEYGTVQGLVTQEDVFETLLGLEITDETDTVEDMQQLALKRWRKRRKEMS
ncbi:MAG: CNNM domain-containing protein, partial [Alphaproteobacteria bacterium]|nr:CNNM domain-containing protein [Alphaproteobacteria bacterium]